MALVTLPFRIGTVYHTLVVSGAIVILSIHNCCVVFNIGYIATYNLLQLITYWQHTVYHFQSPMTNVTSTNETVII